MSRVAFLYPGQGSQRVGMGAELQKQNPAVFDQFLSRADALSGLPVSRYCVEGSIEDLTQTEVTQPALFALSLALTEHALSAGLKPDFVAGHSLGEFMAAVAAGALRFEDGLLLVCERARCMARVQKETPGGMAVVPGLDARHVQALCVQASEVGLVTIANFNAPTQTVVSGTRAGVERLVSLAKQAGSEEAMILWVGVASHTEFMRPAQE